MKPLFFLLAGCLSYQATKGQSVYFVSIDADGPEPFQVVIGKKTYSSDGYGHLLIPHLSDSTYLFRVVFPSGKYADHLFGIPMEKRDHGFQLKKRDDRSWVLYDWQKMEMINSQASKVTGSAEGGMRRTDEFARLMADVVNDSSVLLQYGQREIVPMASMYNQRPARLQEPAGRADTLQVTVQVTSTSEIRNEGAMASSDTKGQTALSSSPSSVQDFGVQLVTPLSERDTVRTQWIAADGWARGEERVVQKVFDNIGKDFRSQLYRDSSSNGVDTVVISIPLEDFIGGGGAEERANRGDVVSEGVPGKAPGDAVAIQGIVMINSDCRSIATDEEVDKLRGRMGEANTEAVRVELARKVMRTHCVSVQQVKGLTALFKTDDGRFRFFEMAYPYVYDTGQFKELIELLRDDNYRGRFRSMVRF